MAVLVEKTKDKIIKVVNQMVTAGLVVGSWGNVSAYLPGEAMMVITPSGMSYRTMKASDLVVTDLDGKRLEGEYTPSSEQALHRAIYRKRPDVGAVVHTHSIYACAMAVARKEIPPVLEELLYVQGGGVPLAGYAASGSWELAETATASLGGGKAVILANHGVVGVGSDLDEAFLVCQVVERAAQVYMLARIAGEPHILNIDRRGTSKAGGA